MGGNQLSQGNRMNPDDFPTSGELDFIYLSITKNAERKDVRLDAAIDQLKADFDSGNVTAGFVAALLTQQHELIYHSNLLQGIYGELVAARRFREASQ